MPRGGMRERRVAAGPPPTWLLTKQNLPNLLVLYIRPNNKNVSDLVYYKTFTSFYLHTVQSIPTSSVLV